MFLYYAPLLVLTINDTDINFDKYYDIVDLNYNLSIKMQYNGTTELKQL